ncbi:MAG: glutamine-hydrolyzing carbamoyl-phosphate synthase small subunit [Deltaproteobacteria bacterium]|jgi:carbamoyl-phosphate synthase small subunit|nr:glutamine-hydrolyzing carbamoyl-phosphate synthase small subunit [Deltaproteobacteria bacterium]
MSLPCQAGLVGAPRLAPAALTLDDGARFEGLSVGPVAEAEGEVIFITAMSGYQEVLTDPSYHGQIVVFTTAHVGNYGTNPAVDQAAAAQPAGAVFHELWLPPVEHWLSEGTLPDYLAGFSLAGLTGVDTRALTLHIREKGARNGYIGPSSPEAARARARAVAPMAGRDLALEVSCRKPWRRPAPDGLGPQPRFRAAVLDFGAKKSILDQLNAQNLDLTVWPADSRPDQFLADRPHGLFLANGPGDPAACGYAVAAVKACLGRLPVFGICLGHQIMGLAAGGRTYKLPFGHHGLNHPVQDSRTGRVWLTSQNHGFCVDPQSLPADVRPSHWNLNDDTVEGLEWSNLPAFSVQFHPEASPGPHDSLGLFARFRRLLEAFHA